MGLIAGLFKQGNLCFLSKKFLSAFRGTKQHNCILVFLKCIFIDLYLLMVMLRLWSYSSSDPKLLLMPMRHLD